MKKLLIAVALLIAYVSAMAITREEEQEGQEIRQKWVDSVQTCALDFMRSIIAGTPRLEAQEYFHYCICKHATLLNDDGKINKQHVKLFLLASKYPENRVPDIVEDCAVQKYTKEETASYMFNCFLQKRLMNY